MVLKSLLHKSVQMTVAGKTIRLYFFCHGVGERCLTLWGMKLPICSRCCGIVVGAFSFPLMLAIKPESLHLLASIVLIAPMLLDGFAQLQTAHQSNNKLRFATGLLAGTGVSVLSSTLRILL